MILNQARGGLFAPGFLKSLLCGCMGVCVCVCAPELQKWVCRTGDKAFKGRLASCVTVIISA